MNPSTPDTLEFDSLLDELILDDLSIEKVAQLEQILTSDERAFDHYRRSVSLHAMMAALSTRVPATYLSSSQSIDATLSPVNLVSLAKESLWMRSRATATVLLFGLAVSLVVATYFAGLAGLVVWDRIHRAATHDQFASYRSDDSAVAIITDTANVKWSTNASSKPAKSSILSGEPLKMESGTMELELKAGTKLVVEGPADWSVDGDNNVSLRAGKLMASVPEQAIGFSVKTPTTKIVDLGTEFGVEVDAKGRTDVEVISGKVDVSYDASAKPDGLRQTVRMDAGAARRFSSRGDGAAVTPIAPWVNKTSIGKSLAKAHQQLPSETNYAAAVLADHPLGYWRLSDGSKDIAADASGNGLNGEYHGVVGRSNPGLCPSTNDRSIRFVGPTIPGWLEIKDVELPPSFTIEFWARSATPEWNTFGWLFSSRDPYGVLIHPELGQRTLHVAFMNANGKVGGFGYEPANIADRFHHYVCVYDSAQDRGCLYFDGAVVGEDQDVFGQDRRTKSVKLSFKIGQQDRFDAKRCGEGWIDELAIYPQALSAEAVRRHFVESNITATDAASKE